MQTKDESMLYYHMLRKRLCYKRTERDMLKIKKKESKGSKIDCTRNANLQRTRIQEEDIIINGATNIKNSDKRNQGIPSDIMSARGKAQISLHSSTEIGSYSLTTTEADHSTMPTFPLQEDERNQGIPSDTMSARGKAQISLESSCEIGPCFLIATEADHSRTPTFSLQQDFPISRTCSVKHITAVTNCESNDGQGKTHASHTHEHNHHTTTSRKRARTKVNKGLNKSSLNILKYIADRPTILPSTPPCKYCGAKRFYHEPKGFCCSAGEIALVSNTVPNELYDIYTSQSSNSDEFLTYIRTYNNTFAFTSFGVKYDKDLCKRNKGIYTFKIQGQVYHYINEIVPTENDPSYLQLYFYDTEHEIDYRTKNSNKLKHSIVEKLVNILKINPYAIFFRSLGNVLDWTDQKIIIKADAGLDQRVFNTPSSSQIAAICIEDTESLERRGRDIIVYNHSGYSHKVEYYYGCFDTLQYPLLFPRGEPGWHAGIKRVDKQQELLCPGQFLVSPNGMKSANEIINQEHKVLAAAKKNQRGVSCREYYCYKLQIRHGDKSILLRAGRLLQQYVVDMYVKLETSRLDYFRRHQTDIRSEVYQGIMDSIALGETRGSKVGRRIVLPASFTGGPRDMHRSWLRKS